MEELAYHPALPDGQRQAALRFSRFAIVKDIVLPAETWTLAISVKNADGTTSVLEAIPGGNILTVEAMEQETNA